MNLSQRHYRFMQGLPEVLYANSFHTGRHNLVSPLGERLVLG